MSKKQVFVVKGFSPWFYPSWIYMHHANIDESVPGQATVTYDKELTDMPFMFYDCYKLTKLDLSNFDTSNVEDMCAMFINCSNLTTIKGIIDMKSCKYFYEDMFHNYPKLKDVKIKNPPDGFESLSGLSKSQYTVVNE